MMLHNSRRLKIKMVGLFLTQRFCFTLCDSIYHLGIKYRYNCRVLYFSRMSSMRGKISPVGTLSSKAQLKHSLENKYYIRRNKKPDNTTCICNFRNTIFFFGGQLLLEGVACVKVPVIFEPEM